MSQECTEEVFRKDVATHQLTVLREDGVYRHLQLRTPGTFCMGYDLITWPGYLCMTGDMGEYVFQRTEDMFQFFRHPRGDLKINRPYWAEKCMAADARGKVKEFSRDLFKAAVLARLAEFCKDDSDNTDAELLAALTSRVEDEVFGELYNYDDPLPAAIALRDIRHEKREVFEDFWDGRSCEEFTYHFTWACYAILWGIQQYDAAKAKAAA